MSDLVRFRDGDRVLEGSRNGEPIECPSGTVYVPVYVSERGHGLEPTTVYVDSRNIVMFFRNIVSAEEAHE